MLLLLLALIYVLIIGRNSILTRPAIVLNIMLSIPLLLLQLSSTVVSALLLLLGGLVLLLLMSRIRTIADIAVGLLHLWLL